MYKYLRKTGEKKIKVTIGLRIGRDLSVKYRYLIRVETFFRTQSCHTTKEAEFYAEFKNKKPQISMFFKKLLIGAFRH
jgi:hypothetical protein